MGGETKVGKHIVLTVAGLLAGLALLAWLRPTTSAGATVLLLLCIAIVNALGAIVALLRGGAKRPETGP